MGNNNELDLDELDSVTGGMGITASSGLQQGVLRSAITNNNPVSSSKLVANEDAKGVLLGGSLKIAPNRKGTQVL